MEIPERFRKTKERTFNCSSNVAWSLSIKVDPKCQKSFYYWWIYLNCDLINTWYIRKRFSFYLCRFGGKFSLLPTPILACVVISAKWIIISILEMRMPFAICLTRSSINLLDMEDVEDGGVRSSHSDFILIYSHSSREIISWFRDNWWNYRGRRFIKFLGTFILCNILSKVTNKILGSFTV